MGFINNVNVDVRGAAHIAPCTYKTVVLKQNVTKENLNVLTQAMLDEWGRNTKFVIKWDYILTNDITVPKHCLIEFDGGSVDGDGYTLTGNNTVLKYANPFLDTIVLSGTFYTDIIPCDTEIFIDTNYNTDRIKSMFCIFGKNDKVVISKNIYNNVKTINLIRNINVDFSGSEINLFLEESGLPNSFISIPEMSLDAPSFLKSVKISNVSIYGNPEFEYDGNLAPATMHKGSLRTCIRLYKVDEVELKNISLIRVESGQGHNEYPEGTPLREKSRYSILAVMYYNHATIDGITIHDCNGDNLICCSPNVTDNNMVTICNCLSYRNYTGLAIVNDGKCRVFNNEVRDYNSSAFNLFCYDSEIYNNTFKNGQRSTAIDLSEGGEFRSKNVSIHDNVGYDTHTLIGAWGSDINIYNNYLYGKDTSDAVVLISIDYIRNYGSLNYVPTAEEKTSIFINDNVCVKGTLVQQMINDSIFIEDGKYCDLLVCEGNKVINGQNPTVRNLSPIAILNTLKSVVKNNYLYGLGRTRESSECGCVIVAILLKKNNSVVSVEYNITDNVVDYDGANAPFVYFSLINDYTNKSDRSSNTKKLINIYNNVNLNTSALLYDYIDRNTTYADIKIYSYGNNGLRYDKFNTINYRPYIAYAEKYDLNLKSPKWWFDSYFVLGDGRKALKNGGSSDERPGGVIYTRQGNTATLNSILAKNVWIGFTYNDTQAGVVYIVSAIANNTITWVDEATIKADVPNDAPRVGHINLRPNNQYVYDYLYVGYEYYDKFNYITYYVNSFKRNGSGTTEEPYVYEVEWLIRDTGLLDRNNYNFLYNDLTLHKIITPASIDNSTGAIKWIEYDGAVAGVARNGSTRPSAGDIYVGFQFFDTSLNKPIYAKTISGSTVTWVDATGATV